MKIMLAFKVDKWEVNQVRSTITDTWELAPKMAPHITLKAPVEVEDFTDPKYLNMCNACEELHGKVEDFTSKLKGFSTFGNHVVFADVELTQEMDEFFELLNTTLNAWGFELNEFEINRKPHVTMATGFASSSEAGEIMKWLKKQQYLNLNQNGIPLVFTGITMYGKTDSDTWQEMKEFSFNG